MLTTISTVCVGFVGLAYLLRKRFERSFGVHDQTEEENVKGKICLVTGANSGLGKEAAYELCRRGAIVIMACRDETASSLAIKEIREKTPNGQLIPMKLDLASFESIRKFAANVGQKFDEIHLLLLNAGVFVPLKLNMKSQEGHEINFAVNHLGHFLLTNLMLDKVKSGARIVVLSSALSRKGKINFDDLMLDKARLGALKTTPYENSKLGNILFVRELANRLSGTGVHTYAVCPGWAKTSLGRHMGMGWKWLIVIPVAFMFMRSAHQGVQTILHCSLSKKVANETGKCYRNCDHWIPPDNVNDVVGKKLWTVSEELVGLQPTTT